MKSRLFAVIGVLVLVAACGGGASTAPSKAPTAAPATPATTAPTAAPTALTIYGAASLKAALDKAKAAYGLANPGTTLTIATDSSSALETQIEQGAPADVFLSADTSNPKKLVDKGLAAGSAVNFAGNLLTIVVPSDNPKAILRPSDIVNTGVKIIAAGDTVPITKYATMLVANLAKEPGYPADFAARYVANVASKEDNVAAIVAKIENGIGDAGIVYVTDAKKSTKIKMIDVPLTANVAVTYAGVVVKGSRDGAGAAAFLAWFAGSAGQAILASLGFLPPPA